MDKKFITVILSALAVFGFLFYWFEIRPFKIRHDCAWTKMHSDEVPAYTQAQADIDNQNCLASLQKQTNQFNFHLGGECGAQPRPAQPAKVWYDPASSAEYQQCLHDKGF